MASLAEQFLDDLGSSSDEAGTPTPAPDAVMTDGGDVLSRVQALIEQLAPYEETASAVGAESGPEYALVASCVSAVADVDEEIVGLHARLRELYGVRFPELETLIYNPLDYARVVTLARNLDGLENVDLGEVLPSGTVITVQVTASSTTGRRLGEGEMEIIMKICEEILALDKGRRRMLAYVEKRAGFMAPNLTAVVGGEVAAKLMGLAGGIRELAGMTSGNLKALGKVKKALQGSSSATTRMHEGVVFTCPLVAALPSRFRSKAGDVAAGKATLAARVDACKEMRDGSMGLGLRGVLEDKFEKWQEPPPAKTAKPLPIPGDEAKRKHRGGKRARKEKERMGLTDMRKLANRVKFGEAEEGYGNDLESEGFGMLGADGSRKLRVQATKTDTVSIAAKRRLAKQKSRGGASDAAALGLTTSLAFTPVQGIELGAMTPAPGGVGLGSMDASDGTKSNYFSAATPFLGVDKPGVRKPPRQKK